MQPRVEVDGREGTKRKRIFVVNDAIIILDLMRDVLEEQYAVSTMPVGPHVLDRAVALRPDLILVDLAVGERAGWDLLEALRADAATSGIPIVVLSTDPRLITQARANRERYGGRVFLTKPFDLDALLNVIAEQVGQP